MDKDTDVNPDDVFNMLAQQSNVIQVPVFEEPDGSIRLGKGVQIKSAEVEDDNVYAVTPVTPTMPGRSSLGAADKLDAAAVTDADLQALAGALCTAVRPSDIRASHTYKDAVLAQQLVDWVTVNIGRAVAGLTPATTCSRATAVALGLRMVQHGWLVPCDDKKKDQFEDGAMTLRYLVTVLEDDQLHPPTIAAFAAKMAADEGGVSRHTEKILLQTYHRAFREGDAIAWILKHVPGANHKGAEKILKVLGKRGHVELLKGSAFGGVAMYRFSAGK